MFESWNFDLAGSGGFAFDPAQATIEKLEPGRVKCKGALPAKSKFQLSNIMGIYHHLNIKSSCEKK